ncbi:MAG: tetratricopeptide repeat protein [Acidobacteria bacterium]|nr:tetratricopeptide repeat protein [Acidobacteriota bacterium]
MSDVIKGAKRSSSRPAPHSAKATAKGRKLNTEAAKPKPKRTAAAKPPVRKAAPAKSSASSTKTTKAARPSASKHSASSKSPAKSAKKIAASKAAPAAKAGAKSHAAPSKAAPAKKAAPAPSRAQPAKSSPAKSSKPAAASAQRPAPRPAPAQPRQPSRDEAAALKAFERAHKDFTRGNFAAARDHFRALIEQHAGVSEVAARARIYLNIAETRLRTEAALPRDPDSLYDRGVIELNRGDFVAAQELFERALKRDPEAADTHYALAAARARLGAIESALHALERAVELRPVLRVRAQADADLALLRNDPEFERIVFPNSRP